MRAQPNTRHGFLDNLRQLNATLLTSVLINLAILFLARISIVLAFAFSVFLTQSFSQQFDLFFLGFRFDLKIIAFFYASMLAIALLCLASNKAFSAFLKIFKVYNALAIFTIFIFAIINFFYFKTYDKCIDAFFFAAGNEDPKAVFLTIIQDYPVITGFIGIVIGLIVISFAYKKLNSFLYKHLIYPKKPLSATTLIVLVIFATVSFARGTLFSTFPLRQMHAQVSDKQVINYAIPNGVIAFYWAYNWNKKSASIPNVALEDLKQDFEDLGIKVDSSSFNTLIEPLKVTTESNEFLKTHKPNIIFNVMESMSYHMFTYDNVAAGRDLYGSLRQHAKEDFFFENFLSEGNGTSDSLTRLFVSSPDLNLSTSVYTKKNYIFNIVKIMKQAGYKTIFVTASTASWRNYNNFLVDLGFDEIIERSQVERNYPNFTAGAWGVDDEFLFKQTFKTLLEDISDKPLFIMTLSITNHPPFRVPQGDKLEPLNIPEDIVERFPYKDTKVLFETFRYANDELGKFISKIKASPRFKDNTVIVATGDHNLRGIGYSQYPKELYLGFQVPFYLYLPKAYIENNKIDYDKYRTGSQKDIMRTVLEKTQSNFSFYSLGCDLLSNKPCTFPYAYNSSLGLEQGKDYVCKLEGQDDAYRISQNHVLYVDEKSFKGDCKKLNAFKQLQQDLYHYQVLQK
ncbi:MAG: sulfatase-like hydrolase/transferase [Succinivibrio sp.]|nr:sulfatase-like hydrolase/transferase [Succinivibrio sp.]